MADDKPMMEGYLLKWTNYMKGFQRRYFILDRGILSYYRFAAGLASISTILTGSVVPSLTTPRQVHAHIPVLAPSSGCFECR